MAHPPTRFNLPADRVHLVLSLVADWQLEHILSTPLLPLFDPRSEDYNFRQRHLYEPFPHTPQYNEDDYVYEPGKIIHGEIRYGNGCINPLWPGYDYRHSWEIEMYRDLGVSLGRKFNGRGFEKATDYCGIAANGQQNRPLDRNALQNPYHL